VSIRQAPCIIHRVEIVFSYALLHRYLQLSIKLFFSQTKLCTLPGGYSLSDSLQRNKAHYDEYQ